MRPHPLLAACGLVLAAQGAALAQSGASLQERRLGVIKGTAPGVTLIEAPRAASAAAPNAPVPPAPKPAAAAKPAPPPVPISAARRLDSPALGNTLPSAGAAASAVGDDRRR